MIVNVIHDPERRDRRILLESEIREQGLEVRYWPALMVPEMVFAGINKAHKQIVRWAMQEKLPMVCIAEDDVHFTGKGAWKYFIDHIPEDFDVYLAGVSCGVIKKDRTVRDFCALHLYIVHQQFYDKFLGVSSELHLDRALADKGKFIVSKPYCAIQWNGYSDNKKKYATYDHLWGDEFCCENI